MIPELPETRIKNGLYYFQYITKQHPLPCMQDGLIQNFKSKLQGNMLQKIKIYHRLSYVKGVHCWRSWAETEPHSSCLWIIVPSSTGSTSSDCQWAATLTATHLEILKVWRNLIFLRHYLGVPTSCSNEFGNRQSPKSRGEESSNRRHGPHCL